MEEDNDSIGRVGAVGSTDLASAYGGSNSAAPAPMISSAARASVAVKPAAQPSAQEVSAAVAQANQHLATFNRVVELNTDAKSGITIATIKNSQTGDVLQQFPSADIVRLAQMLAAWSPGRNMLLDLIA